MGLLKQMKIVVDSLIAWTVLATACSLAQQRPADLSQSGYVLGPDDQILIRVLDGLDISDRPLLIGTNGNITLPLIGRVKAAGLTVEELEGEVKALLKPYIQEPQVLITVTEFRSQPVSVLGAVAAPGIVQLRGPKTLYEVLSMVGGPRDTAGSSVTITRLRENGVLPQAGAFVDPKGRFSSVELDVQEILEGKTPSAHMEIRPRDVISVSQASSRVVYVVGDVQHAGAFSLGAQRTISVLSALSLAGGFGRTAKPERGKILREPPGERRQEILPVNLKEVLAGKAENVALRAGDILVVPTSSRKTFTTYVIPATIAGAVSAAIYAATIR